MATEKDRSEQAWVSVRALQGKDLERRMAQRILLNLMVDCHCEDHFLFAYITDMSTLGIFIRTNNPEPPGTHLNLHFSIPGLGHSLEVEGVVTWVNPYRPGDLSSINPGMGVRFIDLDKEQRIKIRRMIRTICILHDADECSPDTRGIPVIDLQPSGYSSLN